LPRLTREFSTLAKFVDEEGKKKGGHGACISSTTRGQNEGQRGLTFFRKKTVSRGWDGGKRKTSRGKNKGGPHRRATMDDRKRKGEEYASNRIRRKEFHIEQRFRGKKKSRGPPPPSQGPPRLKRKDIRRGSGKPLGRIKGKKKKRPNSIFPNAGSCGNIAEEKNHLRKTTEGKKRGSPPTLRRAGQGKKDLRSMTEEKRKKRSFAGSGNRKEEKKGEGLHVKRESRKANALPVDNKRKKFPSTGGGNFQAKEKEKKKRKQGARHPPLPKNRHPTSCAEEGKKKKNTTYDKVQGRKKKKRQGVRRSICFPRLREERTTGRKGGKRKKRHSAETDRPTTRRWEFKTEGGKKESGKRALPKVWSGKGGM